jgi:hypothetical protein
MPTHLIFSALILLSLAAAVCPQGPKMKTTSEIRIRHITRELSVEDLTSSVWKLADEVEVGTYWSGQAAPKGRHFRARLLWSDTALYVRFEGEQTEPLFVSDRPNLKTKTLKMWDRDVCEIFIAPDPAEPRKYFEFEIAPNGEWIDLTIDLTSGTRETDWNYASGMRSAAKIERGEVLMAIKVEWRSFGRTPKVGETWLGNLFRCVGRDPDRGYLAWQPTLTPEPAFHVPEKFGKFVFAD